MGENAQKKESKANDLQAQRNNLEQQRRAMEIQQQAWGTINPFATGLVNLGQGAMNGQVPNYFLGPMREQLSNNFGTSRQNLIDQLGQSGQLQSGLGVGPLSYLSSDEAKAMADAFWQAQQQAIQYGGAGANILQGQQGIFNPVKAGSAATIDPNWFNGSGILGKVLGGIGGAFLNPFGAAVGGGLGGKVIH